MYTNFSTCRVLQVACGWQHSAGVTPDGRLFTWGWGGAVGGGGLLDKYADLGGGQLGLGDDLDQHTPVQVQRVMIGSRASRDLRRVGGGGAQGRTYAAAQPAAGGWAARQASCGRNHTAVVLRIAEVADWELE